MSVPVVSSQDKTDIVNFFDVFFEKIKTYIVDKTESEITMMDFKRVYFHFAKTCKKVEGVLCQYAKPSGCTECQIYSICQNGEDTIHKKECEFVSLIYKCIRANSITDITNIKTKASALYDLKSDAITFGQNNL